MGGFVFVVPSNEEGTEEPTRAVPTPHALREMMKNFPDIIPDISEESIAGRSKSSGLSKAILIAQVSWFGMNCIYRLVEKLPLSLLEISTVARGFCTLLTYFVWWPKPLNIDITMTTPMDGPNATEAYEWLRHRERRVTLFPISTSELGSTTLARVLKFFIPTVSTSFVDVDDVSAPGQWSLSSYMVSYSVVLVTGIFTQIPYGLFHFLGWNGVFPTPYERFFWKIFTVMTVGVGLFNTLLATMAKILSGHRFQLLYSSLGPFLYLISSGFLTVESVRQLFFLPSTTYVVASWSNFWPHFS